MDLVEIWREIFVGEHRSWVLFKNGTCVVLMEPAADLGAQAIELIKKWGRMYPGSEPGHIVAEKLLTAPGWVVSSLHQDILTYVGPEMGADSTADQKMVGMVGRVRRFQDAQDLEIVHVEDKRRAPR